MRSNQWKIAMVFLLPYLLIFSIFRFIPSVGGLVVSFFKWSLGGDPKFIGIDNYVNLAQDGSFYTSIRNTLSFFVLTVPVLVVASLLLAMLLNQKLAGRRVMRTISIIPYVLIPSIVGIMWNWMFDNNFGLLNYYIKKLGGSPVFWLTDERFALIAVSIVVVWTYIGYDMILFLAGLQGIPKETYEAAEVDGASTFRSSGTSRCPCSNR